MNAVNTVRENMQNRINCVGVICLRGDEVLLIRRGKPPRKGEWSIPGGHIEVNETEEIACLRELHEETGVNATLGEKIAIINANFDGKDYCLHDYVAYWTDGVPCAADDAAHAEFVHLSTIKHLGMWPKTCEVIFQAHKHRETYGAKTDFNLTDTRP